MATRLASVVLPFHNQADHVEQVMARFLAAVSELPFQGGVHPRPQQLLRRDDGDLPRACTVASAHSRRRAGRGRLGACGTGGDRRGRRRPALLHQLGAHGQELDEVYPWGTIRRPSPAANLATAQELSAAEREQVEAHAWQYLEVFGYSSFLTDGPAPLPPLQPAA